MRTLHWSARLSVFLSVWLLIWSLLFILSVGQTKKIMDNHQREPHMTHAAPAKVDSVEFNFKQLKNPYYMYYYSYSYKDKNYHGESYSYEKAIYSEGGQAVVLLDPEHPAASKLENTKHPYSPTGSVLFNFMLGIIMLMAAVLRIWRIRLLKTGIISEARIDLKKKQLHYDDGRRIVTKKLPAAFKGDDGSVIPIIYDNKNSGFYRLLSRAGANLDDSRKVWRASSPLAIVKGLALILWVVLLVRLLFFAG